MSPSVRRVLALGLVFSLVTGIVLNTRKRAERPIAFTGEQENGRELAPPEPQMMRPVEGESRRTLNDWIELAGRVELDGFAPNREIPLLVSFDDFASDLVVVEAGGEFTLKVPRSVLEVVLHATAGYEFDGALPELRVLATSPAPVVRLRSQEAVVGRVIGFTTGSPLPGVKCVYLMTCAAGSFEAHVYSTDTGFFCIPLTCMPVESLAISFWASGESASRELEHLAGAIDLGDVRLAPTTEFTYVIEDESGVPIEGAVLRPERPWFLGPNGLLGVRSDKDGVARLSLPSNSQDHSVRVEALGFDVATAPIQWAGKRESSVGLVRLPYVEVVVDSLSPVQDDFRLSVTLTAGSNAPFRLAGVPSMEPIQQELGAPKPRVTNTSVDGLQVRFRYAMSSQPLLIPGLTGDDGLQLSLEDASGSVVARREISPSDLEAGSHVRFEIGEPSFVLLTIRGNDGVGLASASIAALDGNRVLGKSNDSGVAVLGPFFGEEIGAVIFKDGYAPAGLDLRGLAPGKTSYDVNLTAGASVNLSVRTSDGVAVDDAKISCFMGNFNVGRIEKLDIPGRWYISGLPTEPLVIYARLGDDWFSARVNPVFDGSAVIELPPRGFLRVLGEPYLGGRMILKALGEPDRRLDVLLGQSMSVPAGKYSLELKPEAPELDGKVLRAELEVSSGQLTLVEL